MGSGLYVAFPAHPSDAASLGASLEPRYPSRAAALAACDAQARCHGAMHDGALAAAGGGGAWRLFSGVLWEGVTGGVRAVGENLNPWAPLARRRRS